ncbi:S24 family peptidase [Psychrobacter celer]|uniref:S24 family peptidase n=1 Tax=Psychrobacter celer TaxID=306572 RepID=UPI003FD1EF23
MNETHPTMARVFERTGLEPSALALKINVSPQSVTNWSKRGISKTGALEVAKEFGYSVDWILTGEKEQWLDRIMRVEDVSEVCEDPAAEADIDMFHYMVPLFDWDFDTTWRMDDVSDFVMRPSNVPEWSVCLIVQNQSMASEFNPEDMIFIDVHISIDELKDSDFIVVRKDGVPEAMLRQLLIGDSASEKYIRPYNPDWPDQTVIRLDDSYEMLGKVVAKLITYD